MDDCQAMNAIFYVLRTGIQWKALPREMGPASTVVTAFNIGRATACLSACGKLGRQAYDEAKGIE